MLMTHDCNNMLVVLDSAFLHKIRYQLLTGQTLTLNWSGPVLWPPNRTTYMYIHNCATVSFHLLAKNGQKN